MNNGKFRKALCLFTVPALLSAMLLPSCMAAPTEISSSLSEETVVTSETTTETSETTEVTTATTSAETTEETTVAATTEESSAISSETTAAVPSGDELNKLKNVGGNIWINEDPQYSAIVNELLAQTQNGSVTGSFVVANDTDIIFAAGKGILDNNGNEVTPYTTYEAGSISKSFAAVCILKLAEEGKLSLKNTLGDFFPEYNYCQRYDKNSKITVNDLLYMRSGIPGDPLKFFGADLALELIQDENRTPDEKQRAFYKKVEGKIYMECLFTCELESEPGTKYQFTDANYYVLAAIVEDVTGKPYEEYVNEVILKPCAMANSSSMSYGDVNAQLPKDTFYNPFEGSKGSADIHSSAIDILKYDRALFGGKILKPDSLKTLLTPADLYSCGWNIETDGLIHNEGDTYAFHAHNYVFDNTGKRYYVIAFTVIGDKCPENIWKSISPVLGK